MAEPPTKIQSQPRTPGRQLLGLQATRGAAALMVVAFHATLALGKPQHLGHIPFGGVFWCGHAGVDFLFVLSGFIMAYIRGTDLGRADQLGRYAWHRAIRIYPLYWLIAATVGAHDLIQENFDFLRPWALLEAITLLPTGNDKLLVPPAWTLEHEMLFYCAFGLAIYRRAAATFIVAGCLVLIIVGLCVPAAPWPIQFLSSPYHIQFLLGIATARFIRRRGMRHPLLITLGGVVLFLVTGALDVGNLIDAGEAPSICLYGIASATMIAGIAVAEQAGMLRLGRMAHAAGSLSYPLYLTNLYVVGLVAKICARLDPLQTLPDFLIFSGQIGAAVIIAAGIHVLIVKPVAKRPGLLTTGRYR